MLGRVYIVGHIPWGLYLMALGVRRPSWGIYHGNVPGYAYNKIQSMRVGWLGCIGKMGEGIWWNNNGHTLTRRGVSAVFCVMGPIFDLATFFFGQRQHKIFRRFAPKNFALWSISLGAKLKNFALCWRWRKILRYGRPPCVMYRGYHTPLLMYVLKEHTW